MSRRVIVDRHIAADPSSVALLLAGSIEGDDLVVEPPRRTGVGFTAAVTTHDARRRAVSGELRIEPAAEPGCDVQMSLIAVDSGSAAVLRRSAGKFLSALALRARERSFAA